MNRIIFTIKEASGFHFKHSYWLSKHIGVEKTNNHWKCSVLPIWNYFLDEIYWLTIVTVENVGLRSGSAFLGTHSIADENMRKLYFKFISQFSIWASEKKRSQLQIFIRPCVSVIFTLFMKKLATLYFCGC